MEFGLNDAFRMASALSGDNTAEMRSIMATVSRVAIDGTVWVRFSGSDTETPVERTSATVSVGETVEVVVENGRARIKGNYSNPSAQISYADQINDTAIQAINDAMVARSAATSAQASADEAAESAVQAQASADEAASAAATANANATKAIADAAAAYTAAGQAQTSANQAASAASSAQTSATQANTAANNALSGLSTVQGVVEALGQDVDDLETHVALLDDGLYITLNAAGYKLKLTNNGAYIIDGSGAVVTTFSESITFSSSRPQYIGGEDAYIIFYDTDNDDVPDTIRIGGNIIMGGSKTLTEVLADIAEAKQTALDAATLVITSSNGLLFKNGAESTILQVVVFPSGGDRCDTMAQVRARFGAGAYIEWKWKHEDTGEWGTLVSTDSHISHDGMWLTVTPEDVATKTTFSASLVTS